MSASESATFVGKLTIVAMLTTFRQYTFALLVLLASAASYHAFVTPMLEPPSVESIAVGDDSVLEIDQSVLDLFPEDAWQRGACSQLQTADGMLLFQSWEQVENDQWRLWPVTVIVGRGLSAVESDRPFILEAEKGAEIKFTKSLDVMSGGAPPIQRGRMIGDVRLYRHGNPETDQKLEVLTSNVGIDSQKIWTTESIEMILGSTRLVGRDLTIHLDGPSRPSDTSDGAQTVLDRMELIYLDELVMPLESGSMWGRSGANASEEAADLPMDPTSKFTANQSIEEETHLQGLDAAIAGTSHAEKNQAVISLRCGGRVEYDFALDHLSLRDSVSLVHHVRGTLADRFECDAIQLVLNDPMNGSLKRETALDWISGVVAIGSPVLATLPTFDAELAADRIQLDMKQGIIEAEGSRGVQVRKNLVTARLAKLHYQFDPSNPEAIGSIDAPGAGIVQFEDPEIAVRSARWRQGVKLVPRFSAADSVTQKPLSTPALVAKDGSEPQASVALVNWNAAQQAEVEQPRVQALRSESERQSTEGSSPFAETKSGQAKSGQAAEAAPSLESPDKVSGDQEQQIPSEVDLWVEGDVFASMADGGDFRADSIVGVLRSSKNIDTPGTWVPDRFEISGEVKLNTKALAADADKVLLFFVEAPASDREEGTVTNSGDATIRQWVVQPSENGSQVDPIARSRPAIRGESIRAELMIQGSEIEAKKLSVMGNVEVLHEIRSGSQLLPAKLTGDHLQLIDGGGDEVLQLTSREGAPARLELGDGFFVGPQIQIRPRDNLIWMNAAGEFQLPRAALPLGGSGEGEAGYRWKRTPYCRWNGEMIFDGSTAVLSEGVEIDATLIRDTEVWELELSGDRLQVELSNSIEVEDVKALRQATVENITLMQSSDRPVFVQAIHRGLDGVMEARHLLNSQILSLSPKKGGVLRGEGPGWYRGWVVPKADQPLLATGGSQSGQPMDLNARPITGVHLVFYDRMVASFEGQQLDFTRGVRIGVRPVDHWESVFDARKMDAISAGESTLDCEQLRFNLDPRGKVQSRISGLSARWEMSASNAVVFRTRSDRGLLEGTASRASYSSAKDLFTVEGGPSSPAVFRQTLPDGSAGPEGAVRSMSIRPGTMKVENAVIERLNVAAPGSPVTR